MWRPVILGSVLLLGTANAVGDPVLRDPAIPAALRTTQPAVPSRGAELQAEVQRKLRQRFDAADAGRQGHISRAQAEAAGYGFVARHFDAIDSAGHGSVSWEQVAAFVAGRQRRLTAPSTTAP